MYRKQYHIHFVGIGGIGMSGIAELLLNLGYRVSGSDLRTSDITERLRRLGGTVHQGHAEGQIRGADVVVISSAVRPDNPEVAAARAGGVPVIPRAEMLAELMRLKYSVAVAGAHGKTTTTSIVASVLARGGFDPTVVIGGKLKNLGSNAVLGGGDFLVAEADESDGSFLKMTPTLAVVTNIDREHLDFYKDLDAIKSVFLDFIDRVPFYGAAFLCLDDEAVQELIPRIGKRHVTYGLSSQADVQARDPRHEGLRSRFVLYRHGEALGEILLNLPGRHNVLNATAAAAVGLELDIPFAVVKSALETIDGVQRRMEIKGEAAGMTVVDDYGHHPTEIKTTLEAARGCWPDRRLVVAFQPHRHTRTRDLWSDFTRAFYQSDILVVLPIYAAGEDPVEGVTAEALFEDIRRFGHKDARYVGDTPAALAHLEETLRPGDVFLTLGAGNVWRMGESLLARLKARDER